MRVPKNSSASSSIFDLAFASNIVAGASEPACPATSSSEPDSGTAGVDAFEFFATAVDRGSSRSFGRCGTGSDGTPEVRSTLGVRPGGRLLLDVEGSTITASGFCSIDNMSEPVEGVQDIGGSGFFGSVALRSPPRGGWRAGALGPSTATDDPSG